ncbi:ornithine cyclodeaminase [Rhodophyticola sp. CCM32]|uniref:ornithine cyclodeaminase n=1 Tax=Rhodophyticola sp. CCM32 TaxID=2916397 RepID=UPI00107F6C2D|nr:ornithine cyclodeaminase [Rhodophyticola sp. CCM32]QBX99908.1 ornithine cyclodeaminase [Rhodophyticola sp. CCM32]
MDTPSDKALVPFVSVENMLALIYEHGIGTCLAELADMIEADFKRWPDFDKTPRVASHSKLGVIELMPTSDGADYAFKFVNGHPSNTKAGLQTVTAFGVLASVETGYPELFSEMTLLTALRTAATSAMVTRALAPKSAKTAAIIGNGAQSEFQILGLAAVCGITDFRLFDIEPSATGRCIANLEGQNVNLTACTSTEEAMEGAEVVTTCTADKSYQTILTDNLVGAGLHINAIGGDCPGKTELHRDILMRSDIFVEYPEQTRIEGDIQQLDPDHPVTELWQVLNGTRSGRTSADQVTVFDGVGFAIEDFSAMRWLREKVADGALTELLDLIADPDDPRDLFGMTKRYAIRAGKAA